MCGYTLASPARNVDVNKSIPLSYGNALLDVSPGFARETRRARGTQWLAYFLTTCKMIAFDESCRISRTTRKICREGRKDTSDANALADASTMSSLSRRISPTRIRLRSALHPSLDVASAEFDIPATRISLATTRHTFFSFSFPRRCMYDSVTSWRPISGSAVLTASHQPNNTHILR